MRPDESVAEFENFAEQHGVHLPTLTARSGVEQMLNFFETVRPVGCSKERGDALLYQWGTFDWGEGEHFEVNITRQFIAAVANNDEDITQLKLTFLYSPSTTSKDYGVGNRWCWSPQDIPELRRFIYSRPELAAMGDQEPDGVTLRWDSV